MFRALHPEPFFLNQSEDLAQVQTARKVIAGAPRDLYVVHNFGRVKGLRVYGFRVLAVGGLGL